MKIFIVKDIKADMIYNLNYTGVVKKGIHEAHFNKNGAVSCKSDNENMIGIKLDEFLFLNETDRYSYINKYYPEIPKSFFIDPDYDGITDYTK